MRGLSQKFLEAMRNGLERGRQHGYMGWDLKWKDVAFPYDPVQFLIDRFHQEIDELIVAISKDQPEDIMREAADVANYAMMIADINE